VNSVTSRVEGSGVVVTGAAGGIGRAIATALVAGGARVVINDLDSDRLQRTADEIGAIAVAGDAATVEGVAALIERARIELGRVDMYFANAGVDIGEGLLTSEHDWARALEVNLMSHVRAARILVPDWLETGGGTFVVTASAAGLLTMLQQAPYSVSKHAAVAFAEWLSATYGDRGITVHAICPQGVDTAMVPADGPVRDLLTFDGLASPDDVAQVLLARLSDGGFFVLPHPQVHQYAIDRATDPDRWLHGMRRLRHRLEGDPV